MGFKDIKNQVIKCIKDGAYEHEPRKYDINVKNLYDIGQISDQEVIDLIQCCKGNQYETRLHHADISIEVHILKPVKEGNVWYIKFYFLEPNVVFISVHESGD
jgi:hypothetical protein